MGPRAKLKMKVLLSWLRDFVDVTASPELALDGGVVEDHERAVEDFIRSQLRPGTASWRALESLVPDVAWHGAPYGC